MSEEVTRSATITRTQSDDQGTHGEYESDSGLRLVTGELPWRDNDADISCVPGNGARYLVAWLFSPKHGRFLYHLLNVPGRGDCELHVGNLSGDVSLGFASDVEGCILPGVSVVEFKAGAEVGRHILLKDQRGVSSSTYALSELERDMQDESGKQQNFWLTING